MTREMPIGFFEAVKTFRFAIVVFRMLLLLTVESMQSKPGIRGFAVLLVFDDCAAQRVCWNQVE